MKKHLLFILALCAVFTACKGEVDSLKDYTSENFFVSYESDYGTLPDSIKNGIHVKENTVLTAEQLPELTADNMIFKGWYDGEIEAVAGEYKVTKNVTLTAFWDKNATGPETVQVTVTLKADSETVSSIVKSAGEVIQESEIPALTKTGYTFAGWFTEAGDNDDEEIQLTAGYTVTKDITFIPKWTANEYTITFNSNNAAAETASQTVTYDTTVKLAACTFTYDGFRFIGWTIDADGKGTSYSDGSDFAVTITENITLYAQWAEAGLYIIKYENTRGVENTNPVSYRKTEGVILTDLTPPIGYIFDGWYDSEDSNGNGSGNKVESWGVNQKTGDLTLYAKWSPRTDIVYKVEHWQQNIDDDGYTLTATDNLTGTTGTLTTAAAREYTGFSTKSFELTPIAADGSTVVRIEYVRDIITYTFNANDENESGGKWNDNSETKTVSGKYGATVTAPAAPVKTGFTFGSWNAAIPETFGSANATFIAQWVDGTGTAYKVEHWQQNADDDEYTLKDTENLVGTTAAQTAATAKTYDNFTAGTVTQTSIATDGSTVVKIYYTRNDVTLTLNLDGGVLDSQTGTVTITGKYGSTYTIETPVKTGYTFVSWSSTLPAKLEAGTYTAIYTVNTDTKYTVEHYLQNIYDDGYFLDATDDLTGTTATTTNAAAKTYTGFTAKSFTQTTIAADGTSVVQIYYDRATATYTFNANGENESGGKWDDNSETITVSGRYEAEVTEPDDPTKTGYTFSEWTGTAPVPSTFGTENLTFTASYTPKTNTEYKVKHYLQNEDDEYRLVFTDYLTGTTAEQTDAEARTFEHFTADSFEQAEIAADGSTVVRINYNLETVTFTLDLDGGTLGGQTGTVEQTGKYGQTVNISAPTRTGYSFEGWNRVGGRLAPTFTTNTTYTAKWSAAGGISVTVSPINDIAVTNSTSHSIITFTAEECTSYRWTLDNEVKGTGRTCAIDTLGLYKGTYKISLEAQKNGKWHSYFAQIKVLCDKGIATTAENIVDEIMSMRMSGTLYVTGELNNTDISNIYTAITTLNYNNNNILVSLDLSQVTGLTGSELDFTYCRGLRSITIPNSVTSIGEDAFLGCSGLTSITIPNSVTSIGEGAFEDCSGLTNINIPNSVTSIGEDAFKNCSGLTKINIPNSVTSIGMNAFLGCSGLTSIIIPNSVTSIGADAFKDCTNLANVTFVTIIGWRRIGGDSINFTDLSNPVTAATYLKDNCNYTWTRN